MESSVNATEAGGTVAIADIKESSLDGKLAEANAERKPFLVVQSEFKLLEEQGPTPSDKENIRFLRNEAIKVIWDAPAKGVLKAIDLDSDGEIALALVVRDLSQSLNSFAHGVLCRSYDDGFKDSSFAAPNETFDREAG
jgi:hypothetical protein